MSTPPVGPVATVAQGGVSRQQTGRLTVETAGPGLLELTTAAASWVGESGIRDGLLTLFCRHTSASLIIQENASPDVRVDLLAALDRLAPRGELYRHSDEGPDDMPAHIRTMLTGSHLAVPVLGREMALGTWQGIFLIEHRERPHRREIVFHLIGS